jgi:hypothetical protein
MKEQFGELKSDSEKVEGMAEDGDGPRYPSRLIFGCRVCADSISIDWGNWSSV